MMFYEQRVLRRFLSSPLNSLRYSHTSTSLANTIQSFHKVDWDDRIKLQRYWNLDEKGWNVKVEWRYSATGGIGLFASEPIKAGSLLRTGRIGKNLMQFKNIEDIESFIRSSDGGYSESRLRYVADYLWGFYPEENEVGNTDKERSRFFGMWVPGNGLNHSAEPNTVYRPAGDGGIKEGIDLIALEDIETGNELFDDYRRHGKASKWLVEFAERYVVDLNFADRNTFVGE